METLTDQQAIDAWIQHLEASRGRAARTVEAYGMALAKLREFIGPDRSILTASAAELEAFTGIWLHKRGVVARSRKPYISAVKGFFAWAAGRGLVLGEPAKQLQHPAIGHPLPHALSLANAERLMWAPDLNTFQGIRDAAMLALLLGCGLRVGGLVGLDQEDITEQEVDGKPRLVIRVLEKGGRERLLPVPKEADMLLRIYLDHEELKTFDRHIPQAGKAAARRVLFVATNPGNVPRHLWTGEKVRLSRGAVWRLIQGYGKRAGIPEEQRHPHAFRHLFGTELAEDNVDVLTRQSLMGHADPKSTSIYTQMAMRRAAKVIDGAGPLAKMKSPVSEVLKRL